MICKCGKEFEPCGMCRAGDRHQQCVDDEMCHDCHMKEKWGEKSPSVSSSGEVAGYIACPWCGSKNWKRHMFGVETNYHTCLTCFGNTPPRRTIEETNKDVGAI